MSVTLTEVEARVVAKLLSMASDEFSNHGCNDFDMRRVGLSPEECDELHRRCAVHNGDPAEIANPETGPIIVDWFLMSYFAARLRGQVRT